MSTELLLIRHGQSEGNIGVSKHPDCKLTPHGIEQARHAGLRLARHDLSGFTGLVSPYSRTGDTAAQISAVTGIFFAREELIREWGDVATINGAQYPRETADELIARLRQFLRHYANRRLIVVSHAAPIAALTQLAWGETPVTEGPFWTGVGNCSMRWLRVTAEPA